MSQHYQDDELPPEVLQQIDAVTDSVLQMSDLEIEDCYRRMFPGENPRAKVHSIAEEIYDQFSARGLPYPQHVLDVLVSTAPPYPCGSVVPFTSLKSSARKQSGFHFVPGYVAAILILGIVAWWICTRPDPKLAMGNHTPYPPSGVAIPDLRIPDAGQPKLSRAEQRNRIRQGRPKLVSTRSLPEGKQDGPPTLPTSGNMNQAMLTALMSFTAHPQNGRPTTAPPSSPMLVATLPSPEENHVGSSQNATEAGKPYLCGFMVDVCDFVPAHDSSNSNNTAQLQRANKPPELKALQSNHDYALSFSTPSLGTPVDLELVRGMAGIPFSVIKTKWSRNCLTSSNDCTDTGYFTISGYSLFSKPESREVLFYNKLNFMLKDLPSTDNVTVAANGVPSIAMLMSCQGCHNSQNINDLWQRLSSSPHTARGNTPSPSLNPAVLRAAPPPKISKVSEGRYWPDK